MSLALTADAGIATIKSETENARTSGVNMESYLSKRNEGTMDKLIIMVMISLLNSSNTADTIKDTRDLNTLCNNLYDEEIMIARRIEVLRESNKKAADRFEHDTISIAVRINQQIIQEINRRKFK